MGRREGSLRHRSHINDEDITRVKKTEPSHVGSFSRGSVTQPVASGWLDKNSPRVSSHINVSLRSTQMSGFFLFTNVHSPTFFMTSAGISHVK
jgi:hypothetical protein